MQISTSPRWSLRTLAITLVGEGVLLLLAITADGYLRWILLIPLALGALLLAGAVKEVLLPTTLQFDSQGLTVRRSSRREQVPLGMIDAIGVIGPSAFGHLAIWVAPTHTAQLTSLVKLLRTPPPRTTAESEVIPLMRSDRVSTEQVDSLREFAQANTSRGWLTIEDPQDS